MTRICMLLLVAFSSFGADVMPLDTDHRIAALEQKLKEKGDARTKVGLAGAFLQKMRSLPTDPILTALRAWWTPF